MGKIRDAPHWTCTPLKNAQDFHYLSHYFHEERHDISKNEVPHLSCGSSKMTHSKIPRVGNQKKGDGWLFTRSPVAKKNMLQPHEAKPACRFPDEDHRRGVVQTHVLIFVAERNQVAATSLKQPKTILSLVCSNYTSWWLNQPI